MKCPFCSNEYQLSVWDWWPDDRAFTVMSCCEESHHDAIEWLVEGVSRIEFRDWFEAETGIRVRGYATGCGRFDGQIVLDYGLAIKPIEQKIAKLFINRHHRHCNAPVGWRWGHGCFNGNDLIGVAMVGRPVARAFDATQVVEVNRVCVDPDYGTLAWNACSMLYGACTREARRRKYTRVITYTLQSEPGVSVKAAGFKIVAEVPARRRGWRDGRPTQPKLRWEFTTRRSA